MTITKIIVTPLKPGGPFSAKLPIEKAYGIGDNPAEAVGDLMIDLARSGRYVIEFAAFDPVKVLNKSADTEA